eukprot:scaffold4200_cov164-Amphora_coffeaeformis.AAC.2
MLLTSGRLQPIQRSVLLHPLWAQITCRLEITLSLRRWQSLQRYNNVGISFRGRSFGEWLDDVLDISLTSAAVPTMGPTLGQ